MQIRSDIALDAPIYDIKKILRASQLAPHLIELFEPRVKAILAPDQTAPPRQARPDELRARSSPLAYEPPKL